MYMFIYALKMSAKISAKLYSWVLLEGDKLGRIYTS